MSGLNRRSLFIRGGGALAIAASGTGFAVAAGQAGDGDDVVAGTVERVDGRSAWIAPADASLASPLRVDLDDGATVLRDGPAPLADFVAGDEVAAHGKLAEGALSATSFESVYRVVEQTVTARDGDQLQTDGVDMTLSSDSEPEGGGALGEEFDAKPIDHLAEGDRVVAIGRLDPDDHSTLIVSAVGVVPE
jgi:hypothetical protein